MEPSPLEKQPVLLTMEPAPTSFYLKTYRYSIIYYYSVCMPACINLHAPFSCRCPGKPEESVRSLVLEAQVTLRHPTWLLGTQVGSSGRLRSAELPSSFVPLLPGLLTVTESELWFCASVNYLCLNFYPWQQLLKILGCQSLTDETPFTQGNGRSPRWDPAALCHLVTLNSLAGMLPAASRRNPAPCCSSGES